MPIMANDLSAISSATRSRLERGGQMLIGGNWSTARTSLPLVDPSSGEQVSTFAAGQASDVDDAVAAARHAFEGGWSTLGAGERERLLNRWADLVERDADLLAELETIDVGMPYWMARRLNAEGAIATIRYMAGWPSKIAGEVPRINLPIPDGEFFGFTAKEPVGVVAAILPWNVPLMLAAWKLAPALAAGCTLVVKPSEIAGLSVLLLAELAEEAGMPPGVINIVTGGGDVGAALAAHPGIDKISFTGSTSTGQQVAAAAARSTIKVALELGGKSPQLVFADADLAEAIPAIANAAFLNSGQICVAGSRIYVARSVYQEVADRLTAWTRHLAVGPGLHPDTRIGPLASASQKARVTHFVEGAVKQGASVATEIGAIEAPGYYVRPTILTDVRSDMAVVREEIFGPVATLMPFDDFEEAIALANDTNYGLAACVWTSSLANAHRAASRIRSGKVAINTDPIPYPGLPEGGRKSSGYGRELAQEGLAGYLETKSVLMRIR